MGWEMESICIGRIHVWGRFDFGLCEGFLRSSSLAQPALSQVRAHAYIGDLLMYSVCSVLTLSTGGGTVPTG